MGYCSASGQTDTAKEYISDCGRKMAHAKSIRQNKHSSVLHDTNEF